MKYISEPTKKVGIPNTPRCTAASVFAAGASFLQVQNLDLVGSSSGLTQGACARRERVKWDRLHREPCPVARTVAVIGDRWTLLILRDCFLGVRRFDAFRERLGISRTIIADRLSALVEEGVLRREPYQDKPVRYEYRLTRKGVALYPVLLSMVEWGNASYGTSLKLRHKACGHRLRAKLTCEVCGDPVDASEVAVV